MELDKLRPAAYRSIVFENGRVFYKKTRGGENVGKLYFREGWNGEEQLLYDPSTYKVGVATVIQNSLPSWDGEHVVLGLTASGAEWSELRVLNVSRRSLLPDSIYPSFGAFSWTPDNQSFLYDGGNVTDIKSLDIQLNRKTRLHKIGTPVQADIDIFSNESHPDLKIAPEGLPIAGVDESYPRYVFGHVRTAQNEGRLFYASTSELRDPSIKWNELCRLSDNIIVWGWEPYGDYLYAITHTGAPKRKVVRTRLEHPDWEHAEVVVPEAKDPVFETAKSKRYLFVVYSDGINGRILKCDLATGKHSDVKLSDAGRVDISCPDRRADLCHVVITSWTSPPTRYDYDADRDTFQKSRFHVEANYPGLGDVVAEEVEVPGHDGVMIPLSIMYRKGIPRDGSNSCILEGYGAYGISYRPYFDVTRHSLALHGVVLAVTHPRGGGERGEAWHNAGKKTTKPNAWKDFISCAEYLIKRGYTSPARVACMGASAGGILISPPSPSDLISFALRSAMSVSPMQCVWKLWPTARPTRRSSAPWPIQLNAQPSTKWMESSTCGKAPNTPL